MVDFTITPAVEQRFWAKVARGGPSECWPWVGGATKPRGYGKQRVAGRDLMATHIALALSGQPRPSAGHQALHSCDNPRCVNPAHLRWGVHDDNMADKITRDRCSRLVGETNPNGTAVTPEAIAFKTYVLNSPKGNILLGRELGKSTTLIGDIRRGRKWKHVPPFVERGDWRNSAALQVKP